MAERTPVVAGNWKMNMTRAETMSLLDALLPRVSGLDAGIVICPPFTSLAAAVERCAGTEVRVAAQNMHAEDSGAYTGEVSAPMLVEAGAWGVLLGHSERRQLFGESDQELAKKVPAAIGAGLVPILCVGETEAERDADETEAVLRRQVEADLAGVNGDRLSQVVIAYEPVWAIGTGRTATPEQAAEAIVHIRTVLAEQDADAAATIRILYGGSVNADNAAELLGSEPIDGALVGGASLDADGFVAICEAAAR